MGLLYAMSLGKKDVSCLQLTFPVDGVWVVGGKKVKQGKFWDLLLDWLWAAVQKLHM